MGMGAEGQKVMNSGLYFGEHNEKNKWHGRCIRIRRDGYTHIGYFKDGGSFSVGNFI